MILDLVLFRNTQSAIYPRAKCGLSSDVSLFQAWAKHVTPCMYPWAMYGTCTRRCGNVRVIHGTFKCGPSVAHAWDTLTKKNSCYCVCRRMRGTYMAQVLAMGKMSALSMAHLCVGQVWHMHGAHYRQKNSSVTVFANVI